MIPVYTLKKELSIALAFKLLKMVKMLELLLMHGFRLLIA